MLKATKEIEITIELPEEVSVEIDTNLNPEVTIEAEPNAEVDIDLTNMQIVTYYDFIFEEI